MLLISSDLPELLGMSDRILIMFRGELVKELRISSTTPGGSDVADSEQDGISADQNGQAAGRSSEISEDTILFWATGGKETA